MKSLERISFDSISRFRAVLYVGPPIVVEDVGSANGTSVDGVTVKPGSKVPVALGAVLKVGSIVVVLQKKAKR